MFPVFWHTGRTTLDITPLEQLPPQKSGWPVFLKWFLPLAIGVMIAFGFYIGGIDKGSDMLAWWVLANGVLAGLGALIACAHPLTILASVCGRAPDIAQPHDCSGMGRRVWWKPLRARPKVKDFETLPEDILSVRGFWRNKVTRILLVVVFTNIGSSIGTFVAIPLMAKVL